MAWGSLILCAMDISQREIPTQGVAHDRLSPLDDEVCQNLLAKLGKEDVSGNFTPDCTSMHCGARNWGLVK